MGCIKLPRLHERGSHLTLPFSFSFYTIYMKHLDTIKSAQLTARVRKQHFNLRRPDLSAQLEERFHQEKDTRNKFRLLAMRMGASGAHASQDIADICGVSRATFLSGRSFFV